MIINIIGNNNSYGNTADFKLLTYTLKKLFRKRKFDFKFIDNYQYKCEYADINIFFGLINNTLIPYSKYNIFIPNIELCIKSNIEYLNNIDIILVRSLYTLEIFKTYHKNVKYISWRSSDRYSHTVDKDYNNWLHVSSFSSYKYTNELINLWKPEYPKLTILANCKFKVIPKKVQDNIEYILDYMEDIKYEKLFNKCGVHIYPSEIETFGHTIQEAKLCKSIVLTTDGGSMKELINSNSGFLIPVRKKIRLKKLLGSKFVINNNLDTLVNKIGGLSTESVLEITDIARKEALQNHTKHEVLTNEVFTNIFKQLDKTKNQDLELTKIPEKDLPKISICTLTYNRKNMFKLALMNYVNMSYPKDKVEWIIVDDSDEDKTVLELLPDETKRYELNIKYYRLNDKLSIGKKRNFSVERCTNDIIVFMDDDDYYPTDSVKYRVMSMLENKKDCVFCTTVGCFHINKLISIINVPPIKEPYNERISESTLCFTKQFWLDKKFIEDDEDYEGREFIKDRITQYMELNWEYTIISLLHSKNKTNRVNVGNTPNGCHYGWSDELFVFITSLDKKETL